MKIQDESLRARKLRTSLEQAFEYASPVGLPHIRPALLRWICYRLISTGCK
jgi:hypothetical protein